MSNNEWYLFGVFLVMLCGIIVPSVLVSSSSLGTYNVKSSDCLEHSTCNWEQHTITDINYIDSIQEIDWRPDINNDLYKTYKYPITNINRECILENGEIIGTNVNNMCIGETYNLKICRGKMRGVSVAWFEECDLVCGSD